MKVDLAFLCDYADAGNKIHASGIGVDTILSRSVPVRHPQLFVVVQVRAPIEVKQKGLEIRLVDQAGVVQLRQIGRLGFSRPIYGSQGIARFAMGFYSLEFKRFGEYAFEIAVEGEEVIRLPFTLLKVETTVSLPGGGNGGSPAPEPPPPEKPEDQPDSVSA